PGQGATDGSKRLDGPTVRFLSAMAGTAREIDETPWSGNTPAPAIRNRLDLPGITSKIGGRGDRMSSMVRWLRGAGGGGQRPALAPLLRLYLAANAVALGVAVALGGPVASEATAIVLGWCRIG